MALSLFGVATATARVDAAGSKSTINSALQKHSQPRIAAQRNKLTAQAAEQECVPLKPVPAPSMAAAGEKHDFYVVLDGVAAGQASGVELRPSNNLASGALAPQGTMRPDSLQERRDGAAVGNGAATAKSEADIELSPLPSGSGFSSEFGLGSDLGSPSLFFTGAPRKEQAGGAQV